MSHSRKILITIVALSLQFPATRCLAKPQESVRVQVIQYAKYLNIKVKGDYEIINPDTNNILDRGSNLNSTVTSCDEGIFLKGNCYKDKILISVNESGTILINDRKFRGKIKFIKDVNQKISVINYINLEDYIKGILYHETSHFWPMQVLRAQAIVSRTFVIFKKQENKLKDYDVTSDIYSQVYGGKTSERYRTNRAVEETNGKILKYKGQVLPAFFHATCGGHTEDASQLWNINNAALKGVKCGFCNDSPHFNWHYVLSLSEIQQRLKDAGYKINNIKDIIILGRNKSGRITDLKIVGAEKEINIKSKDFRNLVGPNIIRSTNFNVYIVNSDAVFEGKGWGHGVGMCQWGAYFMAKQGYTTEEILRYYYPGSKIYSIKE